MSGRGKEFWRREVTKCHNRDVAVTGLRGPSRLKHYRENRGNA